MMYGYTTCHPNKADIIRYDHRLNADEVIDLFHKYPWEAELEILNNLKSDEVHYSPSLEIHELENKNNGITFSLIETNNQKEFIVFLGDQDIGVIEKEDGSKALEYFLDSKIESITSIILRGVNDSIQGSDPLEANHGSWFDSLIASTPKWLKILLTLLFLIIFLVPTIIGLFLKIWELAIFAGVFVLLYSFSIYLILSD